MLCRSSRAGDHDCRGRSDFKGSRSIDTWHKVLSDYSILRCPDCLFRCKAQSPSCVMTANVKLNDRLSILRAGDRFRKWNSLDDQRVCSVCERKFKARQVEIRRFPRGSYKLYCPTLGCPSGPHQWIYPRAPVVSEITEPRWSRVGKQSGRRKMESTLEAHGHRV